MNLLNGEIVVRDSEEVEYELIPMSPVRRLEKRMQKLEKSPAVDSGYFFTRSAISMFFDIISYHQYSSNN